MALKIWLPLVSDIKNIGVSDTQPLIMGTGITYAAGKIGNAIKFPNSCASCVHMPGLKLQIFSWAAWFKILGEGAGTSQRMLSEGRDTGSVGTNIWASKTGTTLSWSTHKKTGSVTIELNRWYHVALTADGSNIKLYLDGILTSTTPYTEDSDYAQSDNQFVLGKMAYAYANTGAYFPFNGQLNDVRIYDHCLSAAEVREISQGLVLHYKLDGGIYGNPNLVDGSNTASTSTNTWNFNMQVGDKTNTIEYEDGVPIVVITRGTTEQSGWCFLSYNNLRRNEIKTSTTYTVSFDIKSVQAGTISFTGFLQSNATNYMTNSTTVIQGVVNANSWSHIVLQCTTTSSFSDITIGSQIVYMSPSTSLRATGNIMKFKNIKVEEGTIETIWCPSNSEGIDRSNIEDSSGYNHNGTIVGSVTLAADAARYGISTHIDGAGVITTTTPGADIRTLSCWVKTTKNKSTSQMLVADSASNMCISFYQGAIIGVFGPTRSTGSKSRLGTSYKENNWNHIVVVKTSDDGKRDIYCNGEKLTPVADDYWNVTGGFFIGQRNGTLSGNTPFFGYISDVRAYCTPLLDTDIKQLYNVGMKVDNLGGVHGYEFMEEINNIKENEIAVNTTDKTISYDKDDNIYTLSLSPHSSGSHQLWYPAKNRTLANHSIEIPWGYSFVHTFEIFSDKTINFSIDYNDFSIDSNVTLSGNDNDTNRLPSSVSLTENTWKTVTFSYSNTNESKNPNHVTLYDVSCIYVAAHDDSYTIKIKSPMTYVVDNDSKMSINKNGIISYNQFLESSTKNYGSISKKTRAVEASTFIEM